MITTPRSTAISVKDWCIAGFHFDLVTHTGIEKFRAFLDDAADLVVSYGGSLSGEHGDGQARAALLPKMYGERTGAGLSRIQSPSGIRTGK